MGLYKDEEFSKDSARAVVLAIEALNARLDDRLKDGAGITASASFMPSAISYVAGKTLGTVQELVWRFRDNSLIPPGSLIRILDATIKIDQSAMRAGETSYTGQAYSSAPPTVHADNSTWGIPTAADLSAHRGPIYLGTPALQGGTCYVKTPLSDQDFHLPTSSMFMELVTASTFTANAVARQIFLYGIVL